MEVLLSALILGGGMLIWNLWLEKSLPKMFDRFDEWINGEMTEICINPRGKEEFHRTIKKGEVFYFIDNRKVKKREYYKILLSVFSPL